MRPNLILNLFPLLLLMQACGITINGVKDLATDGTPATNQSGGSDSSTPAAPIIAYKYMAWHGAVGIPMFENTLVTATGTAPIAYAIVPPLTGTGLTFNTSTGAISGTPTSAIAPASYVVTASNGVGTDTIVIEIGVRASGYLVDNDGDSVDSSSGDGVCNPTECTLRAAVTEANAAAGTQAILIPAYMTITLGGTQIGITSSLDIVGEDPANTEVSGGGLSRVFEHGVGNTVGLYYFKIKSGVITGSGGCVYASGGTQTLYGMQFNSCISTIGGGAATMSGATLSYVRYSTFESNDGPDGALSLQGTTARVYDSTFESNSCTVVGACVAGAVNATAASAYIERNLFSKNSSLDFSGALMFWNTSGTGHAKHNTFYRNRSNGGEGALGFFNNIVGIVVENNAFIENRNIGTHGAAIHLASGGGGIDSMKNNIFYRNLNDTYNIAHVYDGSMTSNGYNLADEDLWYSSSLDRKFRQGPFLGADLILGPRGIGSKAFPVLGNSLAIDGGDPGACAGLTDQWGMSRGKDGNGDGGTECDVGPVELRAPTTAAAITYRFHRMSFVTGAPIPSLTPAVSGGTPTSYAIYPTLPAGMNFNTSNGVISGTPTVVTEEIDYRISTVGLTVNVHTNILMATRTGTSFVVNDSGDAGDSATGDNICDDGSGKCTLRAAIEQANVTAGTQGIYIPSGMTINLGSPLTVSTNILIQGGDRDTTIIDGQAGRMIDHSDGNLMLTNLTIQNGATSAYVMTGLTTETTIRTYKVLFKNNVGAWGGAINLTVWWTTALFQVTEFLNNQATTGGGAIHVGNSTLRIRDSELNGNSAPNGGAISMGNANNTFENQIYSTTFRNNTATTSGGAIYCDTCYRNLIFSSTFDNQTAQEGAVLYTTAASPDFRFEDSTFSRNDASVNGSLLFQNTAGSTVKVAGSMNSDNTGTNCSGAGTFSSLGYNVSDVATTDCDFSATGDQALSGGGLDTFATHSGLWALWNLLNSSPALSAGQPVGKAMMVDGRGFVRPMKTGTEANQADAGAYEDQSH